MSYLDILNMAILLFPLGWAAWSDVFRNKEIPDGAYGQMLGIAAIFLALTLTEGGVLPFGMRLVECLSAALLTLIVCWPLHHRKLLGGGDAKLFLCLAVAMPGTLSISFFWTFLGIISVPYIVLYSVATHQSVFKAMPPYAPVIFLSMVAAIVAALLWGL